MKKTLLVLFSVLLLAVSSFAQGKLSDPKELESFLDGIMNAHLKDNHIPGATLAVVKDGKIFFQKGYGYADIDKRVPVDPNTTLFRPGSVSKLFTWTAVMQMSEQGKLDLNADVNKYLTYFKIPNTYPQPITTVHLLTHAPGFEDSSLGMIVKKYEDMPEPKDYLKNHMPARVVPPGKLSAYSNYGCTLAGYLVEILSGTPFNQYAQEKIFTQLGMKNTTFDQKQTPEVLKNMAKGYAYKDGKYEDKGYEFIVTQAAGSAMSTANDMAKFMIAHMTNDPLLLKPETYQEMHATHFGFDPRMDQMCYGFYEKKVNGYRLIGHEGDTGTFHTLLMFSPEYKFGIFVSYNSVGGATARGNLLQAFMDHYYPTPLPPVATPDIQKEAAEINGTYAMNRRPFTTFEKIAQLVGGTLKLSVEKDNTVMINSDARIAEVNDLLFVPLYSKGTQLFKVIDGKMYFSINEPFLVFEKQAWYEESLFHQIVGTICLLIFLAALIGWPIMGIIKRRFSLAHLISWITSLLFVVTLPLILANLEAGVYNSSTLVPYLLVPIVGAAITIVALLFTIIGWVKKYWTLWGRIRYTVVTIAFLVFIWWLNYWNLLGFKF
jgi:CubicO group peptidase (beta-lactamase class C family)